MPRRPAPLLDKHQALLSARQEAEAEMVRLAREEDYLLQQVREAREQVRYYEELLAVLRRDWGRPPPLSELVRKLG